MHVPDERQEPGRRARGTLACVIVPSLPAQSWRPSLVMGPFHPTGALPIMQLPKAWRFCTQEVHASAMGVSATIYMAACTDPPMTAVCVSRRAGYALCCSPDSRTPFTACQMRPSGFRRSSKRKAPLRYSFLLLCSDTAYRHSPQVQALRASLGTATLFVPQQHCSLRGRVIPS